MSAADEFVEANGRYAAQFKKGDLPLPPARKVAVVACMDARLDPARALGLEEGDAHVIRNAGGRASDALRSLIISQQLLGTREVVVVHHTDCGMLTFTSASSIRTARPPRRERRYRCRDLSRRKDGHGNGPSIRSTRCIPPHGAPDGCRLGSFPRSAVRRRPLAALGPQPPRLLRDQAREPSTVPDLGGGTLYG